MKVKALEAIRSFVVSPELAAVVAAGALATFLPNLFRAIGLKLQAADLGVIWSVQGAPVVLTIGTWYLGKDLLHPSNGHRKILVAWAEYWRLVLRLQCALVWGVVGITLTGGGIAALFTGQPRAAAAGIVAGILAAAFPTVTTALAVITAKDILDGATPGG